MHWIQTHILEQLSFSAELRNRDLRPDRVESNLFQYHLSRLVSEGLVKHVGNKYMLSSSGMYWADRYNIDLRGAQPQPKLISIIGIYNQDNEYLLKPKLLQPFVGLQYVPSGKIRLGEPHDIAAQREAQEKLGFIPDHLQRVGVMRATITSQNHIVTDYIGVLYKAPLPTQCQLPSSVAWRSADQPDDATVMPGTQATLRALAEEIALEEVCVSYQDKA